MDTQLQENFFEITVSQEGSDRIMRLFKTVKWLFGASIVMAGNILVLFSFFHFTRLCKKSILLRQGDLFNYSFKWLIRSATFSIITLVVEFLMSIFDMYALINYLSNIPPA